MAKTMLFLPHKHTQQYPFINSNSNFIKFNTKSVTLLAKSYRSFAFRNEEEEDDDEKTRGSNRSLRMEKAIRLFNEREYYDCHDVLESLWYDENDPLRTLLHALLQCSVAFHHLFNQNHKGAMMEFGEGVCKLRKLNFKTGPFYEFERQISDVLNFIYRTQLELAACNEDFCIAMEQTERSYQLLEGFGAGQHLYVLENEKGITYIVFDPQVSYGGNGVPRSRVKLPTLEATSNQLMTCENY